MSVAPAITMATDDEPSSSVASVIARVDQLLGRAVEAAAGAYASASPSDPLRGLFVSDADASRLIRRGAEPLATGLGFDLPLVDVTDAGPAWRRVAAAFALSPAEVDVLALALVAEIDLRYERIFGYLHDDVTKRRLTPDLACQLLCDSFEARLMARRLFAPDASLIRHALVRLVADPGQPHAPIISQGVKLDDGVADFLLGHDDLDRRLASAGAARWDDAAAAGLTVDAGDSVDAIVREMRNPEGDPVHFALLGSDERLKEEIARHAARELEQRLLLVDVQRLSQIDLPFRDAMMLAARTAHLCGAFTLWARADRLAAPAASDSPIGLDTWLSVADNFGARAGAAGGGHALAISEHQPGRSLELDSRILTLRLRVPDVAERQSSWMRRLRERGIEVERGDLLQLADIFGLDDGAINRAVDRAVEHARRRDSQNPRVTAEDLSAAARAQILKALPRYATRVAGGQRWDDIVLPPDHVRQLRELCDRVRHRHIVHDDWGFSQRLTLGKGVAALFSGPSGTGKTMAAQIIAATLGMDLYRVEIPAVVSKYIGETEKALDQLFREAQGTSVILFFDEADALFGKRSEVKDAHDRYANIEISYLLQAIEQYDGLTILATNLRHNVDEAFVRRLAFSVSFPFPEERERRRIWEKCWPSQVPRSDDIDIEFLARQFELTGGNIRNVALAAAFAAAADGGLVTMAHVIRGVRREFQKTGKACVASDFGPHFALLESEAR